ncbi:major facilitator superfamily domain-containing protein [Fennellomyces sp. T-0311]|nr:major facilitator superfamily domain-containing protein [Fennellomyces sp. T-0311]
MEAAATNRVETSENTKEYTVNDRKLARKKQFQFAVTFSSLLISLFVAALDDTILATSLPKIGSEFEAMPISSWVINSYMLTFDAFQPLFSKFSDIFGRKAIIMLGLAMFLLGSVLCGVSKTMVMLIVCRAIQGIGAAGITAMVYIIIADLIPLQKRGSYEGFVTLVFALASVAGPLIGGSLADKLTWRWSFYINLPIGAIAAFLLLFFLRLPTEKQTLKDRLKRIDYAGNFLALAAAVLFLLAMNFGGQMYPWQSAAVITSFILSGILVVLLAIVEVKFAKEPLIPPRLLKNLSVVSVLLANSFFGISFYAIVFYLPIYFQTVRGDSAMWSGIRTIPMQIALSSFSTITGIFIAKLGIYQPLIPISMTLLTLGTGLVSIFSTETSWAMIYGITVVGGVGKLSYQGMGPSGFCRIIHKHSNKGMGIFFPASVIAIQAAVEPHDIAVVLGLMNFVRLLGATLGVAIASAVLNSLLKKNLPVVIPMEYAEQVLHSPEFIRHGLPGEYSDAAIHTYVDSLQFMWYIIVIMAGLGFLSSLFVKKYSLSAPDKNIAELEHRPPSLDQKEQLGRTAPSDGEQSNSRHIALNIDDGPTHS